MATPIGTNTVNSIARRFIMPEITDNIYGSIPLFFRLSRAGKRMVQGGTQIEAPLLYAKMAAGGFYSGYDLLDVSPSDTIKNGAWDWKQYYVPVSVDGLTLIKTDQPEAIANFLTQYFQQAEMMMGDLLDVGLWSSGATAKQIDGLRGAVDDGTVLATYGGIGSRTTTNAFWQSVIDSSTTTMTMAKLQSVFGLASSGGRHPTIIFSTQVLYNAYWGLNVGTQQFPAEPMGHDEQLAQAGFSNLLFNGVPWLVDVNVPASHVFFLNEDYLNFCVSPRADFYLEDFQIPANQDAMVAKLLWAGNLVVTNVARQAKMTALTG